MRSTGWLAWRKLNGPSAGQETSKVQERSAGDLPRGAPTRKGYQGTSGFRGPVHQRRWRLDCPKAILAGSRGLRMVRYFRGSRAGASRITAEIPLAGATIEREARFLSEKLRVTPARGRAYDFAFERGHCRLVDEVARELAEPAGKELEAAAAI